MAIVLGTAYDHKVIQSLLSVLKGLLDPKVWHPVLETAAKGLYDSDLVKRQALVWREAHVPEDGGNAVPAGPAWMKDHNQKVIFTQLKEDLLPIGYKVIDLVMQSEIVLAAKEAKKRSLKDQADITMDDGDDETPLKKADLRALISQEVRKASDKNVAGPSKKRKREGSGGNSKALPPPKHFKNGGKNKSGPSSSMANKKRKAEKAASNPKTSAKKSKQSMQIFVAFRAVIQWARTPQVNNEFIIQETLAKVNGLVSGTLPALPASESSHCLV
ncbi:hypothetical protein BDV93DRAFT_516737 [Ceratobasidium sp. AG-I]|nr:hypothetical protein BDV93DRAFT_516737 [Ceratobasidium sp. AG-I]